METNIELNGLNCGNHCFAGNNRLDNIGNVYQYDKIIVIECEISLFFTVWYYSSYLPL